MRAYLFILLAAVCWGMAPLMDKTVLRQGVSAEVAVIIRSSAAVFAALLILVVTSRTGETLALTGRQLALLTGAGLASSLFGNYFYFNALKQLDAGLVVAATSTYPAITLLAAWVLFGEQLQTRQWWAIILILAGLVLLNWPGATQLPPPDGTS